MRMRILSLLILLAAVRTSGAPVRVLRYDATFQDGPYAALCVIPEGVKNSGARFVCYYALGARGRFRNDTDGSSALQPVEKSDPNFSVWLKTRAPDCGLALIATESEFPTEQLMAATCPDVQYAEGLLASTRPETFINDVRNAVAAAVKPTPAPAQPATATVPAAAPVVQQTTEPPIVDTAPVEVPPPAVTDTDPDLVVPPPSTTPEPVQQSIAAPPDWTTTGLLVLITVLVAALALERLWQIVRQRKFVKQARTDDDVVRSAPNLEQAAVLLQQQRDEARLQLEGTKKKFADAESALRDVDRALELAKGEDRGTQLLALVKSQKELLRLAGVDTASKAIAAIDEKLKERTTIETLLRGRTNVLDYVREANELVDACANSFWSHAKSPYDVRVMIGDFAADVRRVYAAVASGSTENLSAGAMLGTIEQAVRKLSEQQQQLEDQRRTIGAVRGFLSAEWPNVLDGDISQALSVAATRMRDARAVAERTGVSEHDADAMVTALVTLLEGERNAARDTYEILARVREYLALPAGDAAAIHGVIRAEAGTPRRVLRLVVAAALPVARATLSKVRDEDLRITSMLRIPVILDELESFLGRLSTYEGDQLWRAGIHPGFSQNWLHHLFRAEAVLRTYFMSSRLADLGDALAAVAWTFRYATVESGYETDRVQLLAELPAEMDPAHAIEREFRLCPDIRTRVQAVLRTKGEDGFAVDVDTVGLRMDGKVLKRGALFVANRHEWEVE